MRSYLFYIGFVTDHLTVSIFRTHLCKKSDKYFTNSKKMTLLILAS